jgi:hypothetical protein
MSTSWALATAAARKFMLISHVDQLGFYTAKDENKSRTYTVHVFQILGKRILVIRTSRSSRASCVSRIAAMAFLQRIG